MVARKPYVTVSRHQRVERGRRANRVYKQYGARSQTLALNAHEGSHSLSQASMTSHRATNAKSYVTVRDNTWIALVGGRAYAVVTGVGLRSILESVWAATLLTLTEPQTV
jgi:hypothetical protein